MVGHVLFIMLLTTVIYLELVGEEPPSGKKTTIK